LATLLPSVGTAWISYLENKRALEAKASEEIMAVSAQTAREVDLWAKERRYDLRVFASSYEITENIESARGGSTSANRRVTDYLKSVSERFDVYDELLILAAPSGQVIATTGDRAASVKLPEGWQTRLGKGDFVAGTPYWDDVDQRAEIVIAVPIQAGERILGTLAAEVNLLALIETLKGFAPGESGLASLLTADGSLIVSSAGGSAQAMQMRYPRETIQAQLQSDVAPVELTDVTGEPVIGSMRPVPGIDWIVVAAIPTAEVYAQLARMRLVTVAIVAGTLLVAALVGYALGLIITRPLDRLTRAASKVAGGELEVELVDTKGGEVGYLTEVFRDMVSRLKTSRDELERLSVTDPLTGLDNRRRMTEALQNEVLRSRRLEHPFSVVMVDVDHFKAYNDAHGHMAGDEALKRVATVLRGALSDGDSVARYGGEEFFVLLPETAATAAADFAKRVRAALEKHAPPAGPVTLSFGIAAYPAHGDSGEALIRAADAALYEAKRGGRDRVVVARGEERVKAARG
ncbi:MAG TPA: diguanylate cyclase, partial [Gammaproteobacteria bacterium]|nr:diguanylate cyclase [Gammaproteobacteria bacterium]